MADIDKITVNNTTYNIKDSTARNSISPFTSSSTYSDYNSLTENGIYRMVNNCTNGPGAWASAVIVLKGYGNGLLQISFRASNGNVYCRTQSDGTWNSWKQVSFVS